MPQVYNPDGTRIGDGLNPLSIGGTVNTLAIPDPTLTGTYAFSMASTPGVLAANNFLSLFVPAAASFNAIVGGVFVSCTTAAASTETEPMRGFRVTTASAGTLQAASAVSKFISAYPNPGAEVRTANPTVTLGAPFFSSPPAISATVGSTAVHAVQPPPTALGAFILQPGEGLVLRTAAGDVDQRWNISIVWSEV